MPGWNIGGRGQSISKKGSKYLERERERNRFRSRGGGEPTEPTSNWGCWQRAGNEMEREALIKRCINKIEKRRKGKKNSKTLAVV